MELRGKMTSLRGGSGNIYGFSVQLMAVIQCLCPEYHCHLPYSGPTIAHIIPVK